MEKAVIDADFFIKLTTNEASAALFLRVMNDLQMTPVMHKYVYEQELKSNSFIRELVKQNKIEIYDYPDYLSTEQEKKEYEKYFLDSYEEMIGEEFSKKENIYTYHMEKEHLGEIRSVYLALKMEIPYFASDDKGAKGFVRNYVSTSRHVLTVISLIDAIRMCKENGSSLRWKDFNACIPNVYKNDALKIGKIREILDKNVQEI